MSKHLSKNIDANKMVEIDAISFPTGGGSAAFTDYSLYRVKSNRYIVGGELDGYPGRHRAEESE